MVGMFDFALFFGHNMNNLAKIILLIAFLQISDQIDEIGIPYDILPYNMKPYESWNVPPDLMSEMYNKTEEDLAYEDCMDSFSLCRTAYKARSDIDPQICAIDKRTSTKGTFASMCEMIYENCKNENGAWGYFHDGPCKVEFLEDPVPDKTETKPQTNVTYV